MTPFIYQIYQIYPRLDKNYSEFLATANRLDPESNLSEFLSIDEESAIKNECRLVHSFIDLLPIDLLELLPFGGNNNGFSVLAGMKCG